MQRLETAPQDVDEGWTDCVLLVGRKGVSGFKDIIEDWLLEPIEWEHMEYFPREHGGQGQALAFFEGLPHETLVALDVVIVEVDCPGSSYFAAELKSDMDTANKVAAKLEMPFRFRGEGLSRPRSGPSTRFGMDDQAYTGPASISASQAHTLLVRASNSRGR